MFNVLSSKFHCCKSPKVVEHQIDSEKNTLLKLELSQAFEMLGRLQTENMLFSQMIKLADEELKIDKKNFRKQAIQTFEIQNKKKSKMKTLYTAANISRQAYH